MESIVEFKDVYKGYGKKQVLNGINLNIPKGKIVGLLGPNGSGKSTMIKLMNGLLSKDSGIILINGLKPSKETKKIVSYLPERTYLNDWMKVKDILEFFKDFYSDFDMEKAEEMLKSLNIDKNEKLKTMSKGTKEKVQLILVMSRKAELYILDEPIGGVDPAARSYILKTIMTNYLEDSNVNLAVLSLYQEYVDENINIDDLQREVAMKIMPKFLKYCGYEKPDKNLEWVVSLHCDRENNYHFHIAWIEKNKCYKLKNNTLGHRYKLKLDENENNFMKRQVSLSIERNKLYRPALIKINEDIEHLQSYFNPKDKNFTLKNISNLDLEEDIVRLGFLLIQVRNADKKYIKYGSLPKNEVGKEIRYITNEIKNKLFSSNVGLNLSKKEIKESIENLNNIFLGIDKRNNISNIGFESAFDNKMIKGKIEKADNYILNAIVNHALYNYDRSIKKKNKVTNKISLEDLINEIAIMVYKKNNDYQKNKQKFRIKTLENYFIYGSYKNYDKLSSSLRRLSKDSDEAAKQFYEILSDNSYDKNL